MQFLYTLSIRFLIFGIWIGQLFNPKAKKWISGRRAYWTKLPKLDRGKKIVWFHCASLGEFDQGLPLMNKIKASDNSVYLLVTFFSPSGYEHYTKRNHCVDYACYLPADLPRNANRFIAHFQPEEAYFVKYEFWCNFILEAKKQGTKLYSVCTIFRPEHRFFSWYGAFFRETLRQMDHFFVQNETSVKLLSSIGVSQTTLVGDMRFDRVLENKKQVKSDDTVERFLDGEKAFIIGSSWSVDEQFLSEEIRAYAQKGKVIIAPHDISEGHLNEIEKRFLEILVRYRDYSEANSQNILLIDSIGKLANLYQYGTFAYIGGGFTGSLHNILEPAVFGLPVMFGPKHKRFPEAQLFIDKGVGFEVANTLQLQEALIRIEKENWVEKLQKLVESQSGAADKIMNSIRLS